MKITLSNKTGRIPHESLYNTMITLVIAFAILWIIWISIPYTHYSLYLIETKK
jgi:hypothetical protein